MKIIFSKDFLLKISKISIFFTYLFQIQIVFTIINICHNGYLSLKREKMTQEEINKENKEICEKLFLDIFDGDFRP